MLRKSSKILIGISMYFLCLFFALTLVKTDTYAASQDTTWRNYYHVNSKGQYCHNRYIYPSKAQEYGIPEACFQNAGVYHYKGYEGCYSYTVITDEDRTSYPDNNPKNRYLDSYFIVWVNKIVTPQISGPGKIAGNAYAQIQIVYSAGLSMFPTSSPMISVRMTNNNPDLYTTFSSEYSISKNFSITAKTIASLVQSTINVATGGIPAAISETVGYAANIVCSSNSTTKISATTTGADEYSDAGEVKRKSVGVKLSNCRLDKANQNVLLKFSEIYPKDAQSYSTTEYRNAEFAFSYNFRTAYSNKSFTDTYKTTYKVNDNGKISLSILQKDGNLSISGVQAGYAYTGSAFYPNPTIKNKTTVLVKDKDYTISYSNNKEVGTATITITGKGYYTGTVKKTFSIYLKSPTLSGKTTTATSMIAKLSWTKITGATGYELYRSVNGGAYQKINTTSAISYTDGNRSSDKTYRYKIRAYRTVNGVKKYSSYSNVLQK